MRVVAEVLLSAGLVCLLLVVSQLFLKQSLQNASPPSRSVVSLLMTLFKTPTFWLAVASTAVGAVFWLYLLRSRPVSTVYPLLSLSYVLMVPAARIAFGDPITLPKVVGAMVICLGVILVGRAAQ